MPVKKEFTSDISDQQESEANKAFDKLTKSGLFNDLIGDVDATVTFTNKVTEGTKGGYSPASGLLRVRPLGTADEILNTLTHELTHAAQIANKAWGTTDTQSRRMISQGLRDDAQKAGVFYGAGQFELEAWTAANMRPGVKFKDGEMAKLLKDHPNELRDLYSRTVQPMREPVTHTKGYPEMNVAEKALNLVFGYQPTIDLPKTDPASSK